MGQIITEDILYQDRGFNVSDRYNVIPTIDVVQQFQKYGFETTSIQSAGTRTQGKQDHQKHMVRMKSDFKMSSGLRPEVVIYNSYDGTAALKIHVGIFRFVCSNSMVAGHNLLPEFNIKHSNSHWEEELNEFIDTYEEKYRLQKDLIDNMMSTRMSLDDAYELAKRAVDMRHIDKRLDANAVDPLELLVAKRREDRGDDVFTRMNVVQERLMLGEYNKYDNQGEVRKAKILTNIDEIIRVNVGLSDLFEEAMA